MYIFRMQVRTVQCGMPKSVDNQLGLIIEDCSQ